MAGRSLSTEEEEIWAKVAATVRQMEGRTASRAPVAVERPIFVVDKMRRAAPEPKHKAAGEHLDAGWDRRLRRGVVAPERSIDLHGHTLSSAHATLDHALDRAVSDHVRVLLVVTGKAPRDPAPHERGRIRAAIGDWLASSRHAGHIAAVRNAHPRHGGSGALYIVLRRQRGA